MKALCCDALRLIVSDFLLRCTIFDVKKIKNEYN